jgi:DNA-binding CsgD family transcriptional regulator
MTYAYGGIFALSLCAMPLYYQFVHKKQKEPWLLILFLCVSIVNLGYLMLSLSKSLEFALFSNKVAYLGQVMMPMCMFMIISKLSGIPFHKGIVWMLIGLAAVLFGIICTTGYLDWYYVRASLAFENGAAYLVKEYGVLHPLNLYYVIAYFVGMLAVIVVSLRRKYGGSYKLAMFMLIIVFGNIGMWVVEKLVKTPFEILSISYLMSEFAFFFLYLILQDYIHIDDVPAMMPVVDRKQIIIVNNLTKAEKIQAILNTLPEETVLSNRQMDILQMILDFKSRKEIAQELHLSENTVKTHTGMLYKALGVSGRDEIYALFNK